MNNPDTSVIGYLVGDGFPEDIQPDLDAFYKEMADYMTDPANEDSVFLWQGPLNYQDGTQLAADGEKVPLLDIWNLPQLLEGMTGASQ